MLTELDRPMRLCTFSHCNDLVTLLLYYSSSMKIRYTETLYSLNISRGEAFAIRERRMNSSDTEEMNTSKVVNFDITNTRLTGSWLIIARAIWLVLVIPSLGFCIASLLVSYQQVQSGDIPAQGLQELSTIGLSVSGFATLNIIFNVITSAIWYGVGFFIFWRRSDDWLALLAAFVLVMFNVTINSNNNVPSILASVYPALTLPLSLMNFLGGISLGVFFLLFPNGRLVPRWMRLILLLLIISEFLGDFPSPSSAFDANWPGWLLLLMPLVIYGTIIYSQIYRYRRVSTPLQRQQTKWIILGVAVAIGIILGILAVTFLIPSYLNSNAFGGFIITFIIWPAALLLIPISIGFSILRYRLYDIDLLINRTLVYGSLSAILTLVYLVLSLHCNICCGELSARITMLPSWSLRSLLRHCSSPCAIVFRPSLIVVSIVASMMRPRSWRHSAPRYAMR